MRLFYGLQIGIVNAATSCLVVDRIGFIPKNVNAAETREADLRRDLKIREIISNEMKN